MVMAAVLAAVASLLAPAAMAQLSTSFYSGSCASLESIVRSGMASAVQQEMRMGASILRLFFHDCFVNVRMIYTYSFSYLVYDVLS